MPPHNWVNGEELWRGYCLLIQAVQITIFDKWVIIILSPICF